MTIPRGQPALPVDFNLESEVSEIEGRDGETYLQFTTHMVTFYKQTYGEHSRFFMALRDGRLIGAHCSQCKQVMVPAATWHCPNCNFAEMTEIDLPYCECWRTRSNHDLPFGLPIPRRRTVCALWMSPPRLPSRGSCPRACGLRPNLERPGIFVKGIGSSSSSRMCARARS